MTKSNFRGIIAAALVSIGGYSASSFLAGSRSTYICPIILDTAFWMRIIGLISLAFDSLILMGVAELFEFGAERSETRRQQRALMSLGAGLLVSGRSFNAGEIFLTFIHQVIAFIWTIIGIFVEQSRPEHRGQPFLDAEYTRGAFGQALLVLFFILSAWQMVCDTCIISRNILMDTDSYSCQRTVCWGYLF